MPDVVTVATAPSAPQRRPRPWWRRRPGVMVAAACLVGIVVVAALAPWVAPYDPLHVNLRAVLQAPSSEHLMGTDPFGRDVFSRVLYGARISLVVGLLAVAISTAIGVPVGMAAGYFGGRVDRVLMNLTDLLLAFPGLLLAMIVVAILGPGLVNTMIAVGIAQAPERIRLVRGTVLSAREEAYVEASRAAGGSDARVMWRHIFPNVVGPLVVLSTLGLASAILSAAALSFIGLGAQPPSAEWGAMLNGGRGYMQIAWWISVFPGLAIMVTVMVMNVLGDGLRDALDPRLRK